MLIHRMTRSHPVSTNHFQRRRLTQPSILQDLRDLDDELEAYCPMRKHTRLVSDGSEFFGVVPGRDLPHFWFPTATPPPIASCSTRRATGAPFARSQRLSNNPLSPRALRPTSTPMLAAFSQTRSQLSTFEPTPRSRISMALGHPLSPWKVDYSQTRRLYIMASLLPIQLKLHSSEGDRRSCACPLGYSSLSSC